MAWLEEHEVHELGFGHVGKNVKISDKASIYNPKSIFIGDYSRIDDFCLISAGEGGIRLGRNVHISAFSSIVGQESVEIDDFAGISNKVAVFSSTDNFAKGMSNPTIPDEFRNLIHLPVKLCRHALVGSNSVLLPGSYLSDGTSVGSLSVVRGTLEPWSVYLGNPAKKIMRRSKNILKLERQFLDSQSEENEQ